MHVSTKIRTTLNLVLAVAAAACSEGPLAPATSRDTGVVAPVFSKGFDGAYAPPAAITDQAHGPGPRDKSAGDDDDPSLPEYVTNDPKQGIVSFVVDPTRTATYSFGANSVYIPANVICDPATSGYGSDVWDSPCELLHTPITITARWKPRGGHGAVEFSPDLRFAPSTDPTRWVWLTLRDKKMISDYRRYTILWYDLPAYRWIDEAKTDPTLKTWTDKHHNTVYRRVKHFSGYMISAGFTDAGGFDASY